MSTRLSRRVNKPWLEDSITLNKKELKSKVVRVLCWSSKKYYGDVVKIVTDSELKIVAVFTNEAVEAALQDYGEIKPCWDTALLLLHEFSIELRDIPGLDYGEFVLFVERFVIWNLQPGFQMKYNVQNCMENPNIWDQMVKLKTEQRNRNINQNTNTEQSESLTQLLDKMAAPSVEQQSGAHITDGLMEKLIAPFTAEEFIMQKDDLIKLEQIEEWKCDFKPLASLEDGPSSDAVAIGNNRQSTQSDNQDQRILTCKNAENCNKMTYLGIHVEKSSSQSTLGGSQHNRDKLLELDHNRQHNSTSEETSQWQEGLDSVRFSFEEEEDSMTSSVPVSQPSNTPLCITASQFGLPDAHSTQIPTDTAHNPSQQPKSSSMKWKTTTADSVSISQKHLSQVTGQYTGTRDNQMVSTVNCSSPLSLPDSDSDKEAMLDYYSDTPKNRSIFSPEDRQRSLSKTREKLRKLEQELEKTKAENQIEIHDIASRMSRAQGILNEDREKVKSGKKQTDSDKTASPKSKVSVNELVKTGSDKTASPNSKASVNELAKTGSESRIPMTRTAVHVKKGTDNSLANSDTSKTQDSAKEVVIEDGQSKQNSAESSETLFPSSTPSSRLLSSENSTLNTITPIESHSNDLIPDTDCDSCDKNVKLSKAAVGTLDEKDKDGVDKIVKNSKAVSKEKAIAEELKDKNGSGVSQKDAEENDSIGSEGYLNNRRVEHTNIGRLDGNANVQAGNEKETKIWIVRRSVISLGCSQRQTNDNNIKEMEDTSGIVSWYIHEKAGETSFNKLTLKRNANDQGSVEELASQPINDGTNVGSETTASDKQTSRSRDTCTVRSQSENETIRKDKNMERNDTNIVQHVVIESCSKAVSETDASSGSIKRRSNRLKNKEPEIYEDIERSDNIVDERNKTDTDLNNSSRRSNRLKNKGPLEDDSIEQDNEQIENVGIGAVGVEIKETDIELNSGSRRRSNRLRNMEPDNEKQLMECVGTDEIEAEESDTELNKRSRKQSNRLRNEGNDPIEPDIEQQLMERVATCEIETDNLDTELNSSSKRSNRFKTKGSVPMQQGTEVLERDDLNEVDIGKSDTELNRNSERLIKSTSALKTAPTTAELIDLKLKSLSKKKAKLSRKNAKLSQTKSKDAINHTEDENRTSNKHVDVLPSDKDLNVTQTSVLKQKPSENEVDEIAVDKDTSATNNINNAQGMNEEIGTKTSSPRSKKSHEKTDFIGKNNTKDDIGKKNDKSDPKNGSDRNRECSGTKKSSSKNGESSNKKSDNSGKKRKSPEKDSDGLGNNRNSSEKKINSDVRSKTVDIEQDDNRKVSENMDIQISATQPFDVPLYGGTQEFNPNLSASSGVPSDACDNDLFKTDKTNDTQNQIPEHSDGTQAFQPNLSANSMLHSDSSLSEIFEIQTGRVDKIDTKTTQEKSGAKDKENTDKIDSEEMVKEKSTKSKHGTHISGNKDFIQDQSNTLQSKSGADEKENSDISVSEIMNKENITKPSHVHNSSENWLETVSCMDKTTKQAGNQDTDNSFTQILEKPINEKIDKSATKAGRQTIVIESQSSSESVVFLEPPPRQTSSKNKTSENSVDKTEKTEDVSPLKSKSMFTNSKFRIKPVNKSGKRKRASELVERTDEGNETKRKKCIIRIDSTDTTDDENNEIVKNKTNLKTHDTADIENENALEHNHDENANLPEKGKTNLKTYEQKKIYIDGHCFGNKNQWQNFIESSDTRSSGAKQKHRRDEQNRKRGSKQNNEQCVNENDIQVGHNLTDTTKDLNKTGVLKYGKVNGEMRFYRDKCDTTNKNVKFQNLESHDLNTHTPEKRPCLQEKTPEKSICGKCKGDSPVIACKKKTPKKLLAGSQEVNPNLLVEDWLMKHDNIGEHLEPEGSQEWALNASDNVENQPDILTGNQPDSTIHINQNAAGKSGNQPVTTVCKQPEKSRRQLNRSDEDLFEYSGSSDDSETCDDHVTGNESKLEPGVSSKPRPGTSTEEVVCAESSRKQDVDQSANMSPADMYFKRFENL